jgi:hypothetical protein
VTAEDAMNWDFFLATWYLPHFFYYVQDVLLILGPRLEFQLLDKLQQGA